MKRKSCDMVKLLALDADTELCTYGKQQDVRCLEQEEGQANTGIW
jgi:hypothetical protein